MNLSVTLHNLWHLCVYVQAGGSGLCTESLECFPLTTSVLWLLRTFWFSPLSAWSLETDTDELPPPLLLLLQWAQRSLPMSLISPQRCKSQCCLLTLQQHFFKLWSNNET